MNDLGKLGMLFKGHPWHGVSIGDSCPDVVTCFIEIVPTDTIKYEIDKVSGYLKVDRPQKYSNFCPTLYGFLPQTFCGEGHGSFTGSRIGREGIKGDGDPLDICVLTEKAIPRGDILLRAIPIGGLRFVDRNEADDKIIAVMEGDAVFGDFHEVSDIPRGLLDRLRHYFLTYKTAPQQKESSAEITDVYDRQEAFEVIGRCREDYRQRFGDLEAILQDLLKQTRTF